MSRQSVASNNATIVVVKATFARECPSQKGQGKGNLLGKEPPMVKGIGKGGKMVRKGGKDHEERG